MNAMIRGVLVTLMGAAILGCTVFQGKETVYLRDAKDRATQGDVRQELGTPRQISSTPTGEAVWLYEIREEEPGSRWTSSGMWCERYTLTFDAGGILRHWARKSYFHGGELMPISCEAGLLRGTATSG